VDLPVELLARRLEGGERIQTSVDLLDGEFSKHLTHSAKIEHVILVLDASTKKDTVDVVLDRRGLPPIEHPFADDIPLRSNPRWGCLRFGDGVQSEKGGESLGIEFVGLEARLGDEAGLVGVGKDDRGPRGLGGVVEVFPESARLQDDVLAAG
jgi:hypothetical protein